MRKIIVEEWLSLDGHTSDKKGQLDFFVSEVRPSYSAAGREKFLESVDTILLGRRTYEQFVRIWPDRPTDTEALAAKVNGTTKIVFSNTLKSAPWGKWPNAEITTGDPASAVKALRKRPGKNMVVWGSISLAQALMNANLVDEYHIHVCPAITGGGGKLFTDEMDPGNLKLMESVPYGNGTVLLKYQVDPAGLEPATR